MSTLKNIPMSELAALARACRESEKTKLRLWIRVSYHMTPDDWMEVPIEDKDEWVEVVSSSCLVESSEKPLHNRRMY